MPKSLFRLVCDREDARPGHVRVPGKFRAEVSASEDMMHRMELQRKLTGHGKTLANCFCLGRSGRPQYPFAVGRQRPPGTGHPLCRCCADRDTHHLGLCTSCPHPFAWAPSGPSSLQHTPSLCASPTGVPNPVWSTHLTTGGCVNTVSFNPSGDLLVSGSDDQAIMLWDWRTGGCTGGIGARGTKVVPVLGYSWAGVPFHALRRPSTPIACSAAQPTQSHA